MFENRNLNELCRCCLADGHFKSLQQPYTFEGCVEIYSAIIQDTFNITIPPPLVEASYAICEECIQQLRSSAKFKQQVLECERQFQEYCKTEVDKIEVKMEVDAVDNVEVKVEENSVEDYKAIEKEIENIVSRSIKVINKKKTLRALKRVPDPTYEVLVKTESRKFYSCKTCGDSYDQLKKLRVHILQNHNYTCDICQKQFQLERWYKKHLKRHAGLFKCGRCEKMFSNKSALVEHENSHNVKFKCDICKKDYRNKSILIKHLRLHSGSARKVVCDICGHSFNDKTNLRYHVRAVHEKLRPFHCNLCSKTYTAKKHLTVHLRTHTGEKPYKCDECLKDFVSSDQLKRHKIVHDKNYKCVVCSLQFTERGSFKAHVRKHVGNLPYRCQYCEKDFSCRYSLKRHIMAEHEGVRFSCDLCDMKFTQKTQVLRHKKKVHDPNKPILTRDKCGICKKLVVDLEKHNKMHLDRKFSCGHCDKCYSEKSSLNRHIQIFHLGTKKFTCDICPKRYTKGENLNKHKMKVHNTALKIEIDDNLDEALPSYIIHNKKLCI